MTTPPTVPDPWLEGALAVLDALRRWATEREIAGDHTSARVAVAFMQALVADYRTLADLAAAQAHAARDARPALRIVRETEPAP